MLDWPPEPAAAPLATHLAHRWVAAVQGLAGSGGRGGRGWRQHLGAASEQRVQCSKRLQWGNATLDVINQQSTR